MTRVVEYVTVLLSGTNFMFIHYRFFALISISALPTFMTL